jgi:NADPH-dependent 2,4-dienoyl-CoA reductase/sulfur reductase-like enzyme
MDRRAVPEMDALASIVIVGGGAAGYVAASTLRHEGYTGLITMLSADAALPCDRPNLSKGYLAGSASYESNLLRPASFYDAHAIDVRLNSRVARIDVAGRYVETTDHNRYGFDALLLATGAEPVRLDIPGGDRPHVHYLRTVADSRAIVAAAQSAHRAVVIGASFIGMEVASSLRARDIEVHVVAPDAVPMEKILGPDVGRFLRGVHEKHGVTFHLCTTVSEIEERGVRLESGETIDADLVVVGIGVRPATRLAQEAGLEIDRGVLVDAFLETSAPGIFAAGDIARWPDPLSGERIRIEHFVVAERQGQTAARNMLGRRERFAAVPFFWTEQFDVGLAYVGHAEGWDEARIEGDLKAHDATITYCREGRKLAVAVVHRDFAGLRAEVEFERSILADADDPAGEHHARRQEVV